MTGSKANDLTSELSGADLERYKRHIDETYNDFKGRVVEGRQIHPELINLLAGGRVYTGQMAYDLLLEEAERLKKKQEEKSRASTTEATVPASSTTNAGSVQIAEGQEMSPFAPPEAAADVLKAAEQVRDVALPVVEPQLGPLGRGIIDGLGGIRDAAALAAEVFLVSLCLGTR
jgi:ClpP class serine protease